MSTYLGAYGNIALRRKSVEGEKQSVINPSDVNAVRRRFSFDFETGFLISGDQIEITSTNGAVLDFVGTDGWANNTKQSSGKWYVFVDDLGGIRLYDNFAESLDGELATAITLASIVADIPIRVKVANTAMRLVGSVTSYEINTNREAIDVTGLSEEFRSQYSGLMSGSGRITCHWDYINSNIETGNYLLQLILRTEVGSEFDAELFVKQANYLPPYAPSIHLNDQIYYTISGLITNAAIAFQPDAIVEVTADFITTGPIRLRTGVGALSYLLQENGDRLILEQDASSFLALEQED
jgi:hypothetical protein